METELIKDTTTDLNFKTRSLYFKDISTLKSMMIIKQKGLKIPAKKEQKGGDETVPATQWAVEPSSPP